MTIIAPLAGLTVVEYGNDLACAYCAKNFVDMGAMVYLADDAHLVDESPALRAYADDGKRPLIELDTPIDVAIAPPDALCPDAAITVRISDFGEVGPQSQWRAGELVSQAASGLMSIIGDPTKSPLAMGGHQIDYTTGWMAFTGAQIALTASDLGNCTDPQTVRVSRLEAAAYVEWKGRVYSQAGNELIRGERSGPVVIRCADGDFGFYYRASDWSRVVETLTDDRLRRPPFDSHSGRVEHTAEFVDVLESVCADRSADELYRLLQKAGVPAGPVVTVEGLLASAQYAERRFLVPIDVDGVAATAPATPVTFNGHRPRKAQS